MQEMPEKQVGWVRFKACLKDESGQAMAEYAIFFSFTVLMLAGVAGVDWYNGQNLLELLSGALGTYYTKMVYVIALPF